jgi:hypothetical protein
VTDCPSCHAAAGRPHTEYCKARGVIVHRGNFYEPPIAKLDPHALDWIKTATEEDPK